MKMKNKELLLRTIEQINYGVMLVDEKENIICKTNHDIINLKDDYSEYEVKKIYPNSSEKFMIFVIK